MEQAIPLLPQTTIAHARSICVPVRCTTAQPTGPGISCMFPPTQMPQRDLAFECRGHICMLQSGALHLVKLLCTSADRRPQLASCTGRCS